MAYNALNNLIDAYIYPNGVQAITGSILNNVLKTMVSQLGGGYNLMGVAAPVSSPAVNDEPQAYFAATAGTYTNFDGIVLAAGEIAVLLTSGNGSWEKQTIYNVPTGTADLENTADFITNAVTDLVNYYTKTEIDTTLADYATKDGVDETLEDYYDKDEMDAEMGDRYTKSEVDTKLGDYYKKTETYDKDEVDSIVAALSRQEYIVAWDGLAAPDMSAIPAGVTVTYSGTPYTGTLAASASTVNKIYMVWNGVAYDMYATSQDGGYSWVPMGTTTVDLSQYATKDEVSQLEQKIEPFSPISTWETVTGYIISDAWYGFNESVFINVAGRSNFYVKANTETAQFAFLTAIPTVLTDPVSYATGSTRTDVYTSTPVSGSVPANAKYMWVAINQGGTDRIPASIIVDGYDYAKDIIANIQDYGKDYMRINHILPSCNLDNVNENGTWVIDSGNTYTNIPSNVSAGFLRASVLENINLQELYDFSTERLFKRRSINGTYGDWVQIGIVSNYADFMQMRGGLPSGDLNDVSQNGTWVIGSGNTYTNLPANNVTAGFLRSSVFTNVILQEFYDFSTARLWKRRKLSSTWGEWLLISGGSGTTNNYTFNEISQTVNLTATPSITADTNNYLPSSGDATDRTADILAMLTANKVCKLGPGTFYVDSLVMPDDSTLEGCGGATTIQLIAGDNKFAVKMGKRCTIGKLHLYGAAADWPSSPTIGTRHGILWAGNYTQTIDNAQQPQRGLVSDVYISFFDGGGITCYDTGYGTLCMMQVENAHIYGCGAGINISYWSEFHKFTNVRCESCYYGIINNGGNNTFVNCDVSSSRGVGFLIDNSSNQSPNNGHGSCVCCVFNHTASNTGDGIKILGCDAGFVFSGCQIFFSKINIVNSLGIVVADCNFGKNNCDISVDGGGAILFSNNMHQDTPPAITITNNDKVHFVNCYNRSTGAVIGN